jgi:hypothetical protein
MATPLPPTPIGGTCSHCGEECHPTVDSCDWCTHSPAYTPYEDMDFVTDQFFSDDW